MDHSLYTTPSQKRKLIYKEKIGEGSYGEIWLVEWHGSKAAAKRIHKKFFERNYDKEIIEERVTEFMKECEVLKDLDHENIVKMLKVLLPDNKSPVLIMELMHCDLQSYIKESTSSPKVSPEKVVSIALGVAKGLEYLHGLPKPIIHRDLASKNILLTEDGLPKIADLGVSKILAANEDALTPAPGTLVYAAPETYKKVKNHEAKYGVKADIFSFGVVLMEMSVGREPHPSDKSKKFPEIKRRQNDIDKIVDDKLKQLVIKCLQEKSSKRPSASKLVIKLEKIKEEKAPTFDYRFKVLLLGNRNIGKTSLFQLLRNPDFDIDTTTLTHTLQARPTEHFFEYNDNVVKMEIVDTAGEEEYFSLTSSYYRDVHGVFLVYDVSDMASLLSLPSWIASLRKYNSKDNLQMILVGNKVDLRESRTTDLVPRETAVEYARIINSPHVETSARDVDSVTAMYKNMVEILMSNTSPEEVNVDVTTIRLPSSPSKNNSREKKCCRSM